MAGHSREPDVELLRLTRDGERAAFDVFYRRHREQLLGYLARRVTEPEIAADVMAEAFSSMLVLALSERPLPNSPAAWLFTTGKNLLMDVYRRGRVEAQARMQLGLGVLELDDHDIARIHEISEATSLWEELKSQMSAADIAVLQARIVAERPYADVARELQCSDAVVRKRVSRALRTLRTMSGAPDA